MACLVHIFCFSQSAKKQTQTMSNNNMPLVVSMYTFKTNDNLQYTVYELRGKDKTPFDATPQTPSTAGIKKSVSTSKFTSAEEFESAEDSSPTTLSANNPSNIKRLSVSIQAANRMSTDKTPPSPISPAMKAKYPLFSAMDPFIRTFFPFQLEQTAFKQKQTIQSNVFFPLIKDVHLYLYFLQFRLMLNLYFNKTQEHPTCPICGHIGFPIHFTTLLLCSVTYVLLNRVINF